MANAPAVDDNIPNPSSNEFQQPVRLGEHEKMLARQAAADEANKNLKKGQEPKKVLNEFEPGAEQPLNDQEEQRLSGAKGHPSTEDKVAGVKAFNEANNVKTEDQAHREEANRPKGSSPNAPTPKR